jgi:hypothetical protein
MALRRAGVAVQVYDDAPRRASSAGKSKYRRVCSPMDEMPEMKLYA